VLVGDTGLTLYRVHLAMERRKGISSYIKSKRLESGLTPEGLAQACNLSIAEYRDIEGYDDELYMVVPLNTVACLCEHLNITLEELYSYSSNITLFPRDLIKQKLNKMSLSVAELSDFVGIEESYIDSILEDLLNIGNWVMDPVILLTNKLEIDFGSFLNSYFRYRKQ
jgi:transcriptional regulator with XRE-family HTH domain